MQRRELKLWDQDVSRSAMAYRFSPATLWRDIVRNGSSSRPGVNCSVRRCIARASLAPLPPFGSGTSQPSLPRRQRPVPPPPRSPPLSPPLSQHSKPAAPSYLRTALHREVASHAAAQRPHAIFKTLWRHADRFQPEVIEVDACLNSLVKCNAESWSSQRFAGRTRGNVALESEDVLRLLSYVKPALLREHERSLSARCCKHSPSYLQHGRHKS